jgi:hypothetical protein
MSLMFMDRDSRVYRLVSKVAAISGLQVVVAAPAISVPFKTNFSAATAGWQWFNSQLVDSRFTGDGLTMVVSEEAVWWKNKRATSYYNYVSGDVDVIVQVKTRKTTDPQAYPDSGYQFGGVMLRSPASSAALTTENYVFNLVGYRGEKLQIESKSTHNGYSEVTGYDWSSGDAELKISRRGTNFFLYARKRDSKQWIEVNSFVREDLPDTLEVALIAYSFSYGKKTVDLTVQFEHILIQ